MPFRVFLSREAKGVCDELARTDPRKLQKVQKTIGLLGTNLRHPSLHTHEYHALKGPNGEKVFEAYVESKTPAAFRMFWYYGPEKEQITVFALTQHP